MTAIQQTISMNRSARLLSFTRWVVLALIVFSIGTLLLGIALFPTYGANNLQNLSPNTNWTPEKIQVALDQLGWSPLALTWFYAILGWLTSAAYCAIGLIVFRRKADDWFGLYVAVMFSVLGTTVGLAPRLFYQVSPLLGAWQDWVGATAWQFFFILFYLFPDGHFVPRWTRWLSPLWIGLNIIWGVVPSLQAPLMPVLVVLVFSMMGSQIYRYFRHSDAVQKQQTKWVVFMVGVFAIIILIALLAFNNPAPFGQNIGANFLFATLVQVVANLWLLLFPITIGIAIFKYRLWDIDIIIRRTLVYVPLTAIIAGIFAASITLSQRFFVALTGEQSDAATVLTTLIVVAAFDPIKSALQKIVDKRFKEAADPIHSLLAFNEQARAVLQVIDAEQFPRRALDEAVKAFGATGGAIYFGADGNALVAQTSGEWKGDSALSLPLKTTNADFGRMSLGARRNGLAYTDADCATLQQTVDLIAQTLSFSGREQVVNK